MNKIILKEENNSNRTVKYHNDLNLVYFTGWTPLDMDVLFAILSVIKERPELEYTISLRDLKSLADFKKQGIKKWEDQVTKTGLKVVNLTYFDKSESKTSIFALFTRFDVIPENEEIYIRLNEDWDYILNQLNSNFTKYDLTEFISISSAYSKTIYRLIKQWKFKGSLEFSIEEFKSKLNIPEKYTTKNINSRIIKQIEKDLPAFFENFKIEKIYSNRQGSPLTGYKFTWKPEERVEYDPDKYKKEEPKEGAKPVTKTKKKSSGLAQYPDDALVQRRYFNGLNIIALDETFERDKIGNIRYFAFDTAGNYISVTESDYNEPLITVLTDKVQVPKSAQVIIDELKEKEELENREWEKKLSDFFEHLDNLGN